MAALTASAIGHSNVPLQIPVFSVSFVDFSHGDTIILLYIFGDNFIFFYLVCYPFVSQMAHLLNYICKTLYLLCFCTANKHTLQYMYILQKMHSAHVTDV